MEIRVSNSCFYVKIDERVICPEVIINMIQIIGSVRFGWSPPNGGVVDLTTFFNNYNPVFGCQWRFIAKD